MMVALASGIVLDVCCQGKAVHFGIMASRSTSGNGVPRSRACVRAASAAWPLSAVVGRIPPWLSTS